MIKIDLENNSLIIKENNKTKQYNLSESEAFEIISKAWLRVGWDNKHVYTFTWLGRPIIQLPEDMIRLQEIIYKVEPDIIIETGIAHGGSTVFFASLLKLMEKKFVISIEKSLRKINKEKILAHKLSKNIKLIEGDSTTTETYEKVLNLVSPNSKIMVFLDSNHSKEHVLKELELFSKLVSINSYIIVCDGIMKYLKNAPRTKPDWSHNNPVSAIKDFLKNNKNFVCEEPKFAFNESNITKRITYWPKAFLKKIK